MRTNVLMMHVSLVLMILGIMRTNVLIRTYSLFYVFSSLLLNIYGTMIENEQLTKEERELRRYILPEELRRALTNAPNCGYRWFASENIFDLVAYRRRFCDHDPDRSAA